MNNLKSAALTLGRVIALLLIGTGIFKLAFMLFPSALLHSLIVGSVSYLAGKYAIVHISIPNTTYNKIKSFLLG